MPKSSPTIATSGVGLPSHAEPEAWPAFSPGLPTIARPSIIAWLISCRADIAAASLIVCLTGLVAWQRLWLWNGLAHLDIPTFYLPWYAFMGEHLRALQLPGWNPHQFSGAPFAGDPQSGWMYLPAMVAFTFLPAVAAYQSFLIFHLVLAGLSAYALSRILGMGAVASLTVASAYEFGPFVNHISCCLIHVQLSAWIPLALVGVEMSLRARRWSGRAGWWSVSGLCISQMLAGWIGQGAYNGLLVVATFLAYRALFSSFVGPAWTTRFVRAAIDGAGMLLIGVGLAAAGVLPRLDEVRSTNLAGGQYTGFEVDKYANGWNITSVLDWMLTANNGWRSYLFYLGGATIALAIMAPLLARRRYAVPYFAGLTLFVALLTVTNGPAALLLSLLPRWEVLYQHVPTRVTAVQWLGPAMLAGATIEALLRGFNRHLLLRAALVPLVLYASVLPFIRLDGLNGAGLVTLLSVGATCLAVAAFVILPFRWPTVWKAHGETIGKGLVVALLCLVIWDPTGRLLTAAVASDKTNPVLDIPTGAVTREAIEINASSTDAGGAGGFLQALGEGDNYVRFFGYDPAYFEGGWGWPSTYREFYWDPTAQDLLVNARAMRLGIDDIQGYNPVQLSNYVAFLNVLNGRTQNYHDAQILSSGLDSPLLDVLNARYIVIPNELPPGRPRPDILYLLRTHREVFRNARIRVLENENALPRAWVVHETRRTDSAAARYLLDSGTTDPRTTVILPYNTPLPELQTPPEGAREPVSITHYEPDRVTLAAELATSGILVLSETYDHGWHAYVDGVKAPIYLADGLIRAVGVPAGRHDVEFRYEPRSLQVGLVVSIATAALVLLIALFAGWSWSRDRRRSAPTRSGG